jgi:hypothetical protein
LETFISAADLAIGLLSKPMRHGRCVPCRKIAPKRLQQNAGASKRRAPTRVAGTCPVRFKAYQAEIGHRDDSRQQLDRIDVLSSSGYRLPGGRSGPSLHLNRQRTTAASEPEAKVDERCLPMSNL